MSIAYIVKGNGRHVVTAHTTFSEGLHSTQEVSKKD